MYSCDLLQENCKRIGFKQEAATRVLLFHLTLRESNLPIFKLWSFHMIFNSKIKSYSSYLNSAFHTGHTLETRVPLQLPINRLRKFEQLKPRYVFLSSFYFYSLIICTRKEVCNFTLHILSRFLITEDNLTRPGLL